MILIFIGLPCTGQPDKVISPKAFKTKMSQPLVTLLDVRTSGEYKSGHLEKAANIDINNNQFEAQCNKLDKAKPVLVYCFSGARSHRAAEMLRRKGFKVHELDGGIEAWQEAGLPVINGNQ